MRDFQIKQFQANDGQVPHSISAQMNAAMNKEVGQTLKDLEQSFKFDFSETLVKSDPTFNHVLSPEEDQDLQQIKATQKMKICMYLDEFFDVVFEVESSYIKANSFVLKNRNEYFDAMFSNRFKEAKDSSLIQR